VLKRGKAVRGIQNEGLPNYIIHSIANPTIRSYDSGIAVGMGKRGEGLQLPFFYWYAIYSRYMGANWLGFIEFLKSQGAHESDKTAWEASTNITDGLPDVFIEGNLKDFVTPGCRKLYVRAMADYVNPFIYIDRCGFWAPWRVASGTQRTGSMNSKRHRLMVDYVVWFVKQHQGRLGLPDCDCFVCEQFKGRVGYPISPLLQALRLMAFIMGDDYISVSWGVKEDELFDDIMDFVFGTETKTVAANFFDDAEFLRMKFCLLNDMVLPYREPVRVIAKMLYGEHRCKPVRFAAAIYSRLYDIGPNKKLDLHLRGLLSMLKVEAADLKEACSVYGGKIAQMQDVFPFFNFTNEDVVNYINCPLANFLTALESKQ